MFDIENAEGQDVSELDIQESMPFLRIIQSGSPQVKKSHEDYAKKKIEGAEEGDIMFAKDNVTVDNPLEMIIVSQTPQVKAEWKPKGSGGVPVAHHTLAVTTHPKYKKKRNDKDTAWDEFLDQNELIDTIYTFVLFKYTNPDGEEVWEKGIIAFTSTGLKIIKDFNKSLQLNQDLKYDLENGKSIKPKIFCHRVKLSTVSQTVGDNSWMNWKIEHDGLLDLVDDEHLLGDAQRASNDVEHPQLVNAETYALTDSQADDSDIPF